MKKGAKAFYILAPIKKTVPVVVKREEVVEGGVVEVEETIFVDKLVSFKPVPVFRYEDTEGDPLPEDEFDFEVPCEFKSIVEELGLNVKTESFKNFYGSYSPKTRTIRLASPELIVFLHELCHAVDDELHGLTPKQDPLQEVVAEFSAAVIATLLGYKVPVGNVKEYVEHYSFTELFKAFSRVERVVSFVIERTKTSNCRQPST